MKKILAVLLVTVICLGCGAKKDVKVKKDALKFKDMAGREIILEKKAERICLGFYLENYLAVSKDFKLEKVVSMPKGETKDLLNALWKHYSEAIPNLELIPDTGSIYLDTFSVEKLIETKPDVVLLAPFQFDKLGESLSQMEGLGIKVIVIDYNSLTVQTHYDSTIILGKVTGEEKRAEELAENYKKEAEEIQKRVANMENIKKVYIELANQGAETIGNSYGNTMWGAMVNGLKTNNIAMGQIEKTGPLNPEYIISQNPDIIFFSGQTSSKVDKIRFEMGFGITPERAIETAAPYIARKGWENINAVRNKEIYGVDHGGLRTLYDYIFTQFMAKKIHPEIFKDIDPEKKHKEFYEKYLPVSPKGIFIKALME
jgi:iron complex transport system substrate-binding protein